MSGTTISFNVTGPPSTTGFCTLAIPYSTMMPPPSIVTIDGYPIQYTTIFENDTMSIIHFGYQHSKHEMTIATARAEHQHTGWRWGQNALHGLAHALGIENSKNAEELHLAGRALAKF